MSQVYILMLLLVVQLAILIFLVIFLIRILNSLKELFFLDVAFEPTRSKVWPFIFEELNIVSGDVVYDLGCGDARFLIAAAKKYPAARFVGTELDWIKYAQAKCSAWWQGNPKNLTIRWENFYKTDFSDATKMFLFLFPHVMQKLFSEEVVAKLNNLKIISRAHQIKNVESNKVIHTEIEPGPYTVNRLYVYNF